MTKFILVALTTLSLAAPAFAQTIKIEDDGWMRVESSPASLTTVDIDDDGWTRVDAPIVRSDRGPMSAPGACSQLEFSANLSGAQCGVLSLADVATLKGVN